MAVTSSFYLKCGCGPQIIMFYVQYVPAVALGRTVHRAAAAPTMVHVTPSMAPVSVIQDGLAATAHSVRSFNETINEKHGASMCFTVL